jgi:hypothetical protein
MITIGKAIKEINPNANYSINVDVFDLNKAEITWLNGTTPIPVNEIIAKQQELIAEYNAKQYQRNRAKAYPSIQEQLDMQYWDKVNGTDNWEQAINAVKAQYPKA